MMAGLALIGWASSMNSGRAQIIPESFTLITFTNTWHFNSSGTDLHSMIASGTDWRAPTYIADPSVGWDLGGLGPQNGLPLFGFPNQTQLADWPPGFRTLFPNPVTQMPYIVTYYYRTHFNLPTNNVANITLVITNWIDDGVVYWLNGGNELTRERMPTNFTGSKLVYTNLAIANNDAMAQDFLIVIPTNLLAGDNVIAAEVHQQSLTSSDDVFGIENMSAIVEQPIAITNQPQSQTAVAGKPFTFKVGGTGSFPFYSWYHVASNRSSTNLVVSGPTSYFYTVASALATSQGSYFVTITNRFGKVTSSEAVLTVVPDTFGPLLVSAVIIDTNSRSIAVNFDERVYAQSMTSVSNYTITLLGTTNQVVITNAFALINGVRLSLASSLFSSNDYILTVNNVRDGTINTNIVAPNSSIGISFVAVSNIFGMDQVWRFDEIESIDLDPSWKSSLSYVDDPAVNFFWAEAAGIFAYSGTGFYPSCAPVGFSLSLGSTTFYFRKKFNLSTNFGPNPSLRLTYVVDDGAVFYLNGSEVLRVGMPAGTIVYGTCASGPVSATTCKTASTNIGSGLLVKGTNLLAVELHSSCVAGDVDEALGVALAIGIPITPTVPPDPTNASILHIRRPDPNDPNTVNLWWGNTHGVALEAANDPSPTGPWIQVPNMATNMLISVTNSIPVLGSSSTRFYRLHKVGF
jgi:hypothetical protein